MDKAPDAFRTISEVAEELNLPQHVLRFWETRFSQIRPMKRGGGRRYYRPDDVDLLRGIRHLLYGEGYTIRGVQRILKDHGVKFVQTVWQAGAPQPARSAGDLEEPGSVAAKSEGVAERGRGLFGLLPSLLGKDADAAASPGERREPPIEDVTAAASSDEDHARPETQTPASAARPQPQAHHAMPASSREPGDTVEAGGGLPPEDLQKLQATLAELAECRRLLDDVLGDKLESR